MSIYQPLNVERSEVRILTLLPGKENDEPICSLRVHSLDETPKIEALSYVWGDDKPSKPLQLDGHNIKIRNSLDGALRGLRKRFRSRQLWVDALCMNQDDVQEKNHQIPLMAKVYILSSRTIAWLEPFEPHMEEFISIMQSRYNVSRLRSITHRMLLSHAANKSSRAKASYVQKNKDAARSVQQFRDSSYWKCMWTFQETLLARNIR